jgi:arginase
LAVKIVRQVNNIALLGAPTSAAGLAGGQEGAPAALRAAGLADALTRVGFQVTDTGDCSPRIYKLDEEHPRARNVGEVLALLEELRPKIEVAVKSGALPLILSGDDSVVLAAVAGSRRYYRHVSLISMDRDAGLNAPATTPSGCLDGMVISHATGRGAPELVRFWGEPPLVREPDVAIFGIDRIDEPEQRWLVRSPLHRYLAVDIKKRGTAASAREALDAVHGSHHEFVLLFDLDVIASEDFAATNFSSTGGLSLEDVRQTLAVFVREPHLVGLVVAGYNPARDTNGTSAKLVVDLLAGALAARLEEPAAAQTETATVTATDAANSADAPQPKGPIQPPVEEVTMVAPASGEGASDSSGGSPEPVTGNSSEIGPEGEQGDD